MIRIGLLGATTIADRAVIGPAGRTDDVRVTAVAAGDYERAAAFGARHAIPRVHQAYAGLIEDPLIDAVYISTHPAAHFGLALAAMRAGKHVLVEKPICLTSHEAFTLRLARRRAGVCLIEAVMSAHHPWIGAVSGLADIHGLGSVREIHSTIVFDRRADLGYRAFPELGGGAFADTSPYWLQMLQAVQGLDVVAADGSSAFDGPNGTDARFEAVVGYETGVTATLTCALDGPFAADHDFVFDGGALRVRNFFRPAWGTFQLNVFIRPEHGPAATVGFAPVSYYERQLASFAELVSSADGGSAALDSTGLDSTGLDSTGLDSTVESVMERAVERVEVAEQIRLSALRKSGADIGPGIGSGIGPGIGAGDDK